MFVTQTYKNIKIKERKAQAKEPKEKVMSNYRKVLALYDTYQALKSDPDFLQVNMLCCAKYFIEEYMYNPHLSIADFYAKAEALHFRVACFLFDEKMGDFMLEQCEDETMIENMKVYLDAILYNSVVDYGVECFEQENKYLRDHILLPYSLQMLLDKCKNANRKCENIVNTMLIRL